MPTPSGNAPDPNRHSPRTHPFSSCPDAEDTEQQEPQQPADSPSSPASTASQTLQDSQESQSQSSWRPPSSSPSQYTFLRSPADDDTSSPRSATMSPVSSNPAAAVADGLSSDIETPHERGERGFGRRESESMVIDEDAEDDDDAGKDADMDEDIELGASASQDDAMARYSRDVSPLRNLQEQLRGLIQEANQVAIEHMRLTTRDFGAIPNTSRRRPDSALRSAAVYGDRVSGEGSSSMRDLEAEVPAWGTDTSMLGMGHEYADARVIPVSPSSYLRPGSRFHGTQQSERQRYDVQVEIKHVDLRESFLCGYLRIQGLTEDHPTLTTYFEGEIIGTKYGFTTQHPSWGASDKTDLSHWAKFQAFRPFQKLMKKGGGSNIVIKDLANRENIFMRWKEHFLVPDHRVRTIHGASFEGFYYICFNQLRGEVSGIYFHSKSEKFQQLELKHVEDKGCYGAVEFR